MLYLGNLIKRNLIHLRAAVWVANKVPYNQDGTYQGYREDCSGKYRIIY